MKSTGPLNSVKAFTLVVLGLAIAAMGVYVAEADDAPGAGGIGLILMLGAVVLGVKAARNRLPAWAVHIALAGGIVITAFAAVVTHGVVVTTVLFPPPAPIPSVAGPAPASQYAAAATRARDLVGAAIREQNLPGVSVAVGAGDSLVWAEGFGWRDVTTRTPVTPDTRFNIGTAASAVSGPAASLGLAHTGMDHAADWSPEHVGEPEEDFPPFTAMRHTVFQPLGLMAPEYPLAGNRATFYVPRSDDNPRRGRQLMTMRALACCPDGMAFSSTPTDLVRFALATKPGSIDGALAGGTVMSIVTGTNGVVVAVASNIAHAQTAALAARIGEAFAETPR